MTLSWAEAFNKPEAPQPIATTATIMPFAPADGRSNAYAARALADEAEAVRLAPEGQRNDQLNRATFALSQLVASGHIDGSLVRDTLTDAGLRAGLARSEIDKTLGSGFRAGSQHPRQVELREQAPNVVEVTVGELVPEGPAPDVIAHTSWWAEPIEAVTTAGENEPAPDVLVRNDNRGLFYRGKVNGLIGESESGKTWVALHAAHQEAAAGGTVLLLDFEDTPRTTRDRLTTLGCTLESFGRIHYANPDQSLDALASADLSATLGTLRPTLVVVDGVNAAMTLLGLDLNSNTDATVFFTKLLRPLATAGAAASVITVDHVPKNPEARGKGGIGAQAKRAMITGCSLRVEVSEPFGRGQSGKLKLYVDKDRPGHVRGHSGAGKYAGAFIIDTVGDAIHALIEAPNLDPAHEWKPTGVMASISRMLQAQPLSKNAIESMVDGRASTIRDALRHLVADGYVVVEQGSNRTLLHRSIKPFSDEVEEVSDAAI